MLCPTPAATVERYRNHRHWHLFSKEYIFRQIEACSPETICDFGCGDGGTSVELAKIGYRVVGLDISPELIALSKERARLDNVQDRTEFHVVDVSSGEWQGECFDLILVQGVLHHIDLSKGVPELVKLLKPRGAAVIQEPIALSRTLRYVRELIPVRQETSPNERQLGESDLSEIEKHLDILDIRYFQFAHRLLRLVPDRMSRTRHCVSLGLRWLDHLSLSTVPPLCRWAGTVVMTCRKK